MNIKAKVLAAKQYMSSGDLHPDEWEVDEKTGLVTVHTSFSVYMSGEWATPCLPVEFDFVDGNFDCKNGQLTTLKGCPSAIAGHFDCSHNNLTSLEGGPQSVEEYYNCDINNLSTLKGVPEQLDTLFADDNELVDLTSLRNVKITHMLHVNRNRLESLEGIEGMFNEKDFDKNFRCMANPNLWKWVINTNYDIKVIKMISEGFGFAGNKVPDSVMKGIFYKLNRSGLDPNEYDKP